MKPKIKLPIDIHEDLGCTFRHIYKINDGTRVLSLHLLHTAIESLAKRGIHATPEDLRPDLAEVFKLLKSN